MEGREEEEREGGIGSKDSSATDKPRFVIGQYVMTMRTLNVTLHRISSLHGFASIFIFYYQIPFNN
jgi:hypothetical protein